MRSRTNCIIGSGEVYTWAQKHVLNARLLKDHGPRCTAETVLGIALRAAAQSISVSAACRDLAKAPSDHAVLTALEEGLHKPTDTIFCGKVIVSEMIETPAEPTAPPITKPINRVATR